MTVAVTLDRWRKNVIEIENRAARCKGLTLWRSLAIWVQL